MKAIVATAYGAPNVFELQAVAKPQPKEHEILIRVHASAATRADTMMRTGKPYFGRLILGLSKPKHPIPGTGFAGVVVTVGSAVTKFKPGERVFGESTSHFSANAEYLSLSEDGVMLPIPEGLTYAEAAGICDGPLTSINFLREVGKLQTGQKVLINGASGSLGTAAVQLAKYMGAEVTAVCSAKNFGLVESLGADAMVDYTRYDVTQLDQTYDLIYDTVGALSFSACKSILSSNGLYMSPVMSMNLWWNMLKSSIVGTQRAKFSATGMLPAKALLTLLNEIVDVIRAGQLKLVIDRQFPLEKLAEAHTYIDLGHKRGNVVITNVA